MLTGIGTDIIEISRFEKYTAEPNQNLRFMRHCFTEDEQAYLIKKAPQTMAGLFAAKEAVVKALGTGFRGFWPADVEITRDKRGKPIAVLHNGAAETAAKLGVTRIWVSISHCGAFAVAMAAAEAEPET